MIKKQVVQAQNEIDSEEESAQKEKEELHKRYEISQNVYNTQKDKNKDMRRLISNDETLIQHQREEIN